MSYSGLQALRDVDLQLAAGEIVGLIGPNGSGKTTLLNVLSGVTRATHGRIMIGDRDVTSMPAHRIARLGVARTFQNIRLFGNLTVLRNVQVGAALDAKDKPRGAALWEAARAVLAELNLEGVQDRRAVTLPYGVRRRVEIARALATRPRFLLLDEPAAGANETESDELRELIVHIADRYQLGILLIEHDLRMIMRVASRIVALNGGEVIAEGDAEQISQHPGVREAYFGKRWAERQARVTNRAPDQTSNEETT
ncbi:MAG TPA: ABC transporter ATP-binding protein [Jiangellales bacterium]|nr:ABC transporter ATP-binding protein [Jiangellales bacterium]